MNFPQFWARGDYRGFQAWRWSANSLQEAQQLAEEAAQKLAVRFRSGERLPNRGYYPDRPFREEILREVRNSANEISAVITRNSYGCEVLNTARIMFVDIDLPDRKPQRGFFQRLFGKPIVLPDHEQSAVVLKIENWTRQNAEWGWRIYRTHAGLRLLATQGLIGADAAMTGQIFEAFGADPLYRKLCESQNCFRARLTPKPWRCGIRRKPERWPWLTSQAENRFRRWEEKYKSRIPNWATCELIRTVGNRIVHPEVQSIVEIHDQATGARTKLPLA